MVLHIHKKTYNVRVCAYMYVCRYNIDPFGKYTDTEILRVLKEVCLQHVDLGANVSEGGGNFSAGQVYSFLLN